nr:hypothetical protein CFP56_43462 [Quercus suber]
MDRNNNHSTPQEGNEQELHSYTKWLAVFGVLFGPLLTILGLKYQSPDVSLFDIHGALMLLLIIDVCIFTISMAVTILPTFNRTHLPFFKGVFLISGVFAYDLILLMLVPPFGWFIFTICASVMVLLLYCSRKHILGRCQEILEPMWHSTSEAFHSLYDWFRQSFQSVWMAPSQASTESSMPIPNMTEKHVVGSVNNV